MTERLWCGGMLVGGVERSLAPRAQTPIASYSFLGDVALAAPFLARARTYLWLSRSREMSLAEPPARLGE